MWFGAARRGDGRWLEDGTLRLPEIRAVGFDAAEALAKIATRHTRGKLVLAAS